MGNQQIRSLRNPREDYSNEGIPENNVDYRTVVEKLKEAIREDQSAVDAIRENCLGKSTRKKRIALKRAKSLQMRMYRNGRKIIEMQQLERLYRETERKEKIKAMPNYQHILLAILSSSRVLSRNKEGLAQLPSELIRKIGEMLFAEKITVYVRNFFNSEVSSL
jgi:hypothetical protein